VQSVNSSTKREQPRRASLSCPVSIPRRDETTSPFQQLEQTNSPAGLPLTMSLTLDDFANRFEYLKQYTDTSTQMIHDLLSYSRKLETTLQQETQQLNDELRDCRLDLTDAIKTRRELQQQVLALKENELLILDQNNSLKNRNPYICMLIDGDGLIFQEQWIKQGIEGGKRAAYALRAAVVEQCSDRGRDVEIVAKIVANLGGLSKAMQRDGSIVSPSDLKDFTLGFTQAKASFDFIDVGYGKERADSKIRGQSTHIPSACRVPKTDQGPQN
jgi:hypothetical protein